MVLWNNCCLNCLAGDRWELDSPRDCEDTIAVEEWGILVEAIWLVACTGAIGIIEGVEVEEILGWDAAGEGNIDSLRVLELGDNSVSEWLR